MTDPRYHSSVTDPDETSPISADRLAELRESADRDSARDASSGRDASGRDSTGRDGATRDVLRAERPSGDLGAEPGTPRSGGSRSPAGAPPGASNSDRPGPISRGSSPVAPVSPSAAGSSAAAGGGQGWYDQQRYTARPGDAAHSGSNGQNGYSGSGYPGSAGASGVSGAGRDGVAGRASTPPPGASRSGRPAGPPSSSASPVGGSDQRGRAGSTDGLYGGSGTGYGGAGGYSSGATPAAGSTSTASSPYAPGGSAYTPPSSAGYGNEATSYAATGYSSGGYGATSYAGGRDLSSSTGTGMTVGGAAGAVGAGPFVGGATLGTSPSRGRQQRGAAAGRPARRARLMIKQIDPWSTFKFSLVLAIAMFFVWLVAIGVLYGVLDGIGVFKKINDLSSELSGTDGQRLVTPGLVLGLAALVGAVNIVLTTALATIGAFVYNICSDLVGGIEVTLAERD